MSKDQQRPQDWAEGESLERVYDEKIAPLMDQIIAVCKEHEMPVVASFQYGAEDLCTTFLPFGHRMNDRLLTCRRVIYYASVALPVTRRQDGKGDLS